MFGRKRKDLDDEIRAHLEIERRRQMEAGASPAEAAAAARRDFGNVLQVKEVTRQMWGWMWLEQFAQDARYAWRALLRNPGFALVAALSLGLGIGAVSTIFSVFDAVALRPMPLVPESERLVRLIPEIKGKRWMLTNPIFEGLLDRQQSLVGLFAANEEPFMKVEFDGSAPSYLRGSVVSGAYFRTLGLKAVAGRLLDENDDQLPEASRECAAVLGHGFWTRRFKADPATLGRKLRVREAVCTVVGVAPAGFASHQPGYEADLWVPMRQAVPSRSLSNHFGAFFSGVVGRLKPGVTSELAQTQLTALFQQLQAIEPPPPSHIPNKAIPPQDVSFRLVPGGHGFDAVQREFEQPLSILVVLVGVVLLIASANVGGLVLARGAARGTEFATRAAIGAGRGRLARQLLAEGAVLACLGGAVGLGVAFAASRPLASFISVPWLPTALDVTPNLRLLAAAFAATACATLLTSLLPAWRLGAVGPGVRSTSGVAAGKFGRGLVVGQLALSLSLIVSVGLLVHTLAKLSAVKPGFDPEHVVAIEIGHEIPRTPGVPSLAPVVPVYSKLEERLSSIPGVTHASLSWLSLFGGSDLSFRVSEPGSPQTRIPVHVDYVSPDYFATTGMTIRRGRGFTRADRDGAPRVAVVNEAFAASYKAPLVDLEESPQHRRSYEIVGVVGDSKYNDLRESSAKPMIWVSLAQLPQRVRSVMLRVQSGNEQAAIRAAREALTSVDPNLMVRKVTTLKGIVKETTARERLLLGLSACFGGLALLLAAIGVYGALSFAVTTRTREIGIRLALGADPGRMLRSVIGGALRLAVVAILLGLPLAYAAGRLLRSFLFGVEPSDSLTIAAACATILAAAMAAAFTPARRAARVEPVQALRYE